MTVPVQLRFADLDPLNHVNNVAYFALMETARVELLRTQAKSLFGSVVIAHSECDYKAEIRGGTRVVDITVSIEKIGTTSFTVLHELRVGDELKAIGRTVQVARGADGRARALTEDERTLLAR
jgi:acyl-CoA thioesterase FadM